MAQFKSPTGELIHAVLESVPTAVFVNDISEDGTTVTYDSSASSTLWWHDSAPIKKGDSLVFIDEESAQWTFDQLTRVEDEEEDEGLTEAALPTTLFIEPAERDIIIAALRLWQDSPDIPLAVRELAENEFGEFLTDDQIDDLVERINA